MTPENLVRLLAEPDRMRVLAAVALGARTSDAVVPASGLPVRACLAALHRLREHGLLILDDNGLAVDYGLLRELSRTTATTAAEGDGPPDDTDAALRPFLRGERLIRLPAQQARRRAVLQHVAERSFTAGRRYDEPAVNERLRAWCEGAEVDHVTIRRYLIDMRILSRADGFYELSADPTAQPGPAERYVRAMGLD